jgi:hypothetical protein
MIVTILIDSRWKSIKRQSMCKIALNVIYLKACAVKDLCVEHSRD